MDFASLAAEIDSFAEWILWYPDLSAEVLMHLEAVKQAETHDDLLSIITARDALLRLSVISSEAGFPALGWMYQSSYERACCTLVPLVS